MEKFTQLDAVAAPLMRANIDTDAIIPSREMKRVSKSGLSVGLFADWRYTDVKARVENPDFVLNQDPYRGSPILITGTNFGCGSSREHAVWALKEFGVRCIIAPSFGAIFQSNCVRNGILPVVLPEDQVQALAAQVNADRNAHLSVDLQAQVVVGPDGARHPFTIPEADKEMLIEGLDLIGVTLKRAEEIGQFETAYRRERPWRKLDLRGADGEKLNGIVTA